MKNLRSKKFRESYGDQMKNLMALYGRPVLSAINRVLERQKNDYLLLLQLQRKSIKKDEKYDPLKVQLSEKDEFSKIMQELAPILNQAIVNAGELASDLMFGIGYTPDSRAIQSYFAGEGGDFAIGLTRYSNEKVLQIVKQGIQSGSDMDTVARNINSFLDEQNPKRALRIARTETAKAVSYGTVAGYEQSGVVEAIEWSATGDDKQCQWCGMFDGMVIGFDEDFVRQGKPILGLQGGEFTNSYEDVRRPPLHPNCRCSLVPVLEGERENVPDWRDEHSNRRAFDVEKFMFGNQEMVNAKVNQSLVSDDEPVKANTAEKYDWHMDVIDIDSIIETGTINADLVAEIKERLENGLGVQPLMVTIDSEERFILLHNVNTLSALKELGAKKVFAISGRLKDEFIRQEPDITINPNDPFANLGSNGNL